MSPEEAQEFGLIDSIINRREEASIDTTVLGFFVCRANFLNNKKNFKSLQFIITIIHIILVLLFILLLLGQPEISRFNERCT